MTLMIGSSKITPSIFPKNNIKNQDKTITENGVYTADEGYTGLGEVTVDVLSANNEDKVILENGVYEADYEKGYTGLGEVTVQVPSIGGNINALNTTGNTLEAGTGVYIRKELTNVNNEYTQGIYSLPNNDYIFIMGTYPQDCYILNTKTMEKYYVEPGTQSTTTLSSRLSNGEHLIYYYPDGTVYFAHGTGMSRIDDPNKIWYKDKCHPIHTNPEYLLVNVDGQGIIKICKIDKNSGEIIKTYDWALSDRMIEVNKSSSYPTTVPPYNLQNYYYNSKYVHTYYKGYIIVSTYTGSASSTDVGIFKIDDENNKAIFIQRVRSYTEYALTGDSAAYGTGIQGYLGFSKSGRYFIQDVHLIDLEPSIQYAEAWDRYEDTNNIDVSESAQRRQRWTGSSLRNSSYPYCFDQRTNTCMMHRYLVTIDETVPTVTYESLTRESIPGSYYSGIFYCQNDSYRIYAYGKNLYIADKNPSYNVIQYTYDKTNEVYGELLENINNNERGLVRIGSLEGNLQAKAVTQNGLVQPSSGYYGLKSVNVNVVGDGVEIEGKNYTGAVINEGDKVWINPYYYEAGTTYTTITNGYSGADGYGAIVLPDGNSVAYTKSGSVEAILYDFVTNNNLGSLSYKPNSLGDSSTGSFGSGSACCFRYIDGTVYTKNSSGMQRIDSGLSWGKSNYSPIYGSSEYIFNFNDCTINYIDKNNGDIIKTYSLPIITDIEYWKFVRNQNVSPVFLDKNHILFPWYNYSVKRTYILSLNDENNSADIIKYYNVDACYPSFSRPVMLGITSDKKYLINIGLTYNTPTISNINVYDISDIDNDLSLVSNKFPELIELALGKGSQADYYNNYIAAIQNQVTLDPKNNLLWSPRFLSISSTQLPCILKYNPNDESFTVINMDYISLSQEVNATSFIGCSGDLDAIWFNRGSGNKPIKLNINISSGNSLINYNISNINSQTGTASEIISAGATGLVKVGAVINEAKNVIATNLTSSNINIGDKVWLNISTNELVDFINATQDTYTAIADESIEINATGQVHYQD